MVIVVFRLFVARISQTIVRIHHTLLFGTIILLSLAETETESRVLDCFRGKRVKRVSFD